MFYYGYHFWGMHLLWWFFWIVLLVWVFSKPYRYPREQKESHLDI